MCYKITFLEKKASKLAERYNDVFKPNWQLRIGYQLTQTTSLPGNANELAKAKAKHIENWEQTIDKIELPTFYLANAFIHPKLAIIITDGIFDAEWGLYPNWVKKTEEKDFDTTKTANARVEDALDRVSYKKLVYTRRGILPVNGIFEFQKLYGASSKPKDTTIIPYRIFNEDDFLSIGVLWDIWKPQDQELAKDRNNWRITFSMMTTKANSLMAQIHNDGERMPLFLNPEDEKLWLNMNASEAEVQTLFTKPYSGKLSAYTVARDINKSNDKTVDRPNILDHVKYNIPDLVY